MLQALAQTHEPQVEPSSKSFESPIIQSDRIDRILATVRDHLGMEIAFVSRYVDGGEREFTHISTDLPIPHKPGLREPQEESFCYHILEGRLPELIHDAADYPLAQSLPITNALPVGCHLNVPLRLSSGETYGSFCCLSRAADRTITQRDMGIIKAFAALAIEQIETDLENDVRHSGVKKAIDDLIETRTLAIVQQPIFSLGSAKPIGVECLARFPDFGDRGPDKWFADAELVGLGFELEMLAITLALDLHTVLPSWAYLSVNASPSTLMREEFLDAIKPFSRERLVIEMTEHQQIDDMPALARRLRELSAHARIAIDDVGAGHSGLQQIVELSPDILKLDMSLTRNIDHDPVRRALGLAMVDFGRQIGATILAEGIETEAELNELKALGVDLGQGYFLGRPQPVPAIQRLFLGVSDEGAH